MQNYQECSQSKNDSKPIENQKKKNNRMMKSGPSPDDQQNGESCSDKPLVLEKKVKTSSSENSSSDVCSDVSGSSDDNDNGDTEVWKNFKQYPPGRLPCMAARRSRPAPSDSDDEDDPIEAAKKKEIKRRKQLELFRKVYPIPTHLEYSNQASSDSDKAADSESETDLNNVEETE